MSQHDPTQGDRGDDGSRGRGDARTPGGDADQTSPIPTGGSQGPQQTGPIYSGWQQPGPQGPGTHPAYGQQQPGPPQGPGPHPAYGQQQPGPPQGQPYGGGGYAASGAHLPPSATTRPTSRRQRRAPWLAVPTAAILAAILASGGTYALTQPSATGSGSSGTSTTIVKANPADFGNAGMVDWAATASKVAPSVVSITVINGQQGDQGSGVVLDKSGNIVTNNHVVALVGKGGTVQVTLNNNDSYQAKVIGTDPSTDLAVVRLQDPPKNLSPITMGNDSKLVVGQPVMAIGNPLGLSGTVTTGIVSALDRPVTTQEETTPQGGNDNPFGFGSGQQQAKQATVTTNAIQTSAAINPGNSGGALVSGSGKLVGINSAIATVGQSSASSQSGNIGIGFAIPVSVVKNITGQLIADGVATHARVGISVQTATVKVDDATEQAAKVAQVNTGSAASRAGLKVGDVITAVDGKPVVSADSLVGYIRAKTVGEKVTLTVIRGGKQMNVTVTLGADTSGS